MSGTYSLLILETASFVDGYAQVDAYMKAYPLSMVKHIRICPGKACFVLGATTDIVQDMYHQLEKTPSMLAQTITGVHPELLSSLQRSSSLIHHHLGIFEFRHTLDAITFTNYALHHTSIHVYKIQAGIGLCGKSLAIIDGYIGDLETLCTYAEREYTKALLHQTIIHDPSDEFLSLL